MRICFVVGMFPSISEKFVLDQITGLQDLGHEVFIYAGARSTDTAVHQDVFQRGLLQRTYYYNDKPASRCVRFLKFLVLFPAAFFCAPGPALRALNIFRYGREALSLNFFFRMKAFLAARDCDIVLCHFGQNGMVALSMKQMGVLTGKLATVFHASDISVHLRRKGRGVYQELFRQGDLFLPISVYARQKLLQLGCPEQKIRVHPMGVDPAAFSLTGRKAFSRPPLNILSVARLVEKKGIEFALEAAALLKQAGIRFCYTIVGDGPLREMLRLRAEQLGVMDVVFFAGAQDSCMVRQQLQQADVLLAPSIHAANGDEEGVPVVLMEAMASGVVVVTTLTGAAAELVADRVTGFVVPPRDPRAIADVLRELCREPGSLPAVVMAARRKIVEQHDVTALNRRLADLFGKEVS